MADRSATLHYAPLRSNHNKNHCFRLHDFIPLHHPSSGIFHHTSDQLKASGHWFDRDVGHLPSIGVWLHDPPRRSRSLGIVVEICEPAVVVATSNPPAGTESSQDIWVLQESYHGEVQHHCQAAVRASKRRGCSPLLQLPPLPAGSPVQASWISWVQPGSRFLLLPDLWVALHRHRDLLCVVHFCVLCFISLHPADHQTLKIQIEQNVKMIF